jgi:hypothetical protein
VSGGNSDNEITRYSLNGRTLGLRPQTCQARRPHSRVYRYGPTSVRPPRGSNPRLASYHDRPSVDMTSQCVRGDPKSGRRAATLTAHLGPHLPAAAEAEVARLGLRDLAAPTHAVCGNGYSGTSTLVVH